MEAVQDLTVQHIVTTLVDKMYVEELEEEYVKYRNKTIKEIITHLRDEWWVTTTTTLEKKQAIAEFNTVVWNHGKDDVSRFTRDLDKAQKLCLKVGIKKSDAEKVQAFTESMILSELFEEKELTDYEDKVEADKDWDNTKKYFIKLIKSKKGIPTHSKRTVEDTTVPTASGKHQA